MAETTISALTNELTSPAGGDLLAIDDISASETKKIQVDSLLGGVTQAEMGYVHGVTSDVQTQIDGKAASSHNHAESDITDLDHDAQKIKGKTVDDTDIANTKLLKYNSTSGNLEYEADNDHNHTESDITDLDHDAQKIKSKTVDDTDIADGKILKYNATSGNLEYESESGGGVSADSFPGTKERPKFIYTETLKYDGGSALFVEGETVTGAGGATGVVVVVAGNATAGYLFINTRNATAYVDNEVLTGSIAGAAVADGASTKDSIVLGSFHYHHQGTTEQIVYSDSRIGFRFGSAGSNAGSTNLGASDCFYVYLDDSAIVTAGTALITDSELIAITTEPSESESKHGHYNGNDKCILEVKTDASSNLLEFLHDGGDFFQYATQIEDLGNTDIDDIWTDVTLSIPVFCTKASAMFDCRYVNGNGATYYRTNGQTNSTGIKIGYVHSDSARSHVVVPVFADADQKIEVKHALSNQNTMAVNTHGWYFPAGM